MYSLRLTTEDVRRKFKGYRYQDLTTNDVYSLHCNFRSLKPQDSKPYVHRNGSRENCASVSGTIPVRIEGHDQQYNIPVRIWLRPNHPYVPPLVYVTPTQNMGIKQSQYVDTSGFVYLPYISDWEKDSSDLSTLVQIMCATFADRCPVYTKAAQLPTAGSSCHPPAAALPPPYSMTPNRPATAALPPPYSMTPNRPATAALLPPYSMTPNRPATAALPPAVPLPRNPQQPLSVPLPHTCNNPRLLKCNHVCCQQCMVVKAQQGQPAISCPTCSELTVVPSSGVKPATNAAGQPLSPGTAPKAAAVKAEDVLSKLEDSVTCSVCMDTYSDPKVLQCHHTFCCRCLVKLVGKNEQGQPVISCPICRQDTSVPANGVAALQSAFHINHLQEMFKQIKPDIVEMGALNESSERSPNTSNCMEHRGEQLKLYCNSCKKLICYKCALKTGQHHSHDYEDACEKFLPSLSSLQLEK